MTVVQERGPREAPPGGRGGAPWRRQGEAVPGGRAGPLPDGRTGAGVVGVIGARGGAGATVLAATLARHLARRAPAVLVQAGPGPSVDTVLGLEAAPGLRWSDLAGARGAVDPVPLAGGLVRWGRCAVLATDDARPGPPAPGVLPDVLDALTRAFPSVVLDLDRSALLGAGPGGEPAGALDACDRVLLAVPRDVPGVAGARLLHLVLRDRVPRSGIVACGRAPGGLGTTELAEAVGLPLVGTLPQVRRLAAAVDHGAGPALTRSAARAVARIAARLP
ncbi:pilus assembly protein FlpE [Cellulomonas sp. C5510]|uniref:pilus assembly protein FlpE n=1 Tax=Cellulomonas sp. C5510 TaxID=2871170 RepID=UPI0021041DD9|nr:pilus assembly protein FlpE [Cellulomonas sp. C5510]